MVRKIGFGDQEEAPSSTPKKSIADQAMDRFRKRAKIKAAREAGQKKESRSRIGRVLFLSFWLILWVAMSGAIIFTMVSEGLNTNVIPLVIWTGASVFVASKVIRAIIRAVAGDPRRGNRPDNF